MTYNDNGPIYSMLTGKDDACGQMTFECVQGTPWDEVMGAGWKWWKTIENTVSNCQGCSNSWALGSSTCPAGISGNTGQSCPTLGATCTEYYECL